MDQLNIPVLLGTNRKERKSVLVAKWLVEQMHKRPEIRTRLFDVAEFALPQDDYGQGLKDSFPNGEMRLSRPTGSSLLLRNTITAIPVH